MKYSILLVILSLCVGAQSVLASLSGGTFEIYGDTFSFVNTGLATGGNYALFDTGGEFFATSTSGGDYTIRGGFRSIEKGVLSFTISSSTLSLGTLTTTTVSNVTTTVYISTDNNRGYMLAVRELTGFVSGGNDIDDVADGEVTAGSEEYGIHVGGTDTVSTSARALTSSYLTIASSTGSVTNRSIPIGFYAAISSSTAAGNYSHTVRFLATVQP